MLEVGEIAGYEHRHLHVLHKSGPTPANLPRRPGMAKKRPLVPGTVPGTKPGA